MPFPTICLNDKQHRPNEWPTFRFQQNTCGTQVITLHDDIHAELQLDPYIHKVYLYAVERLSGPREIFCIEGTIIDGPGGKVQFDVNECHTCERGLFLAKVFVQDTSQAPTDCNPADSDESGSSDSAGSADPVYTPGKQIRQYLAYVEIETDWTLGSARSIGVTLAEVRLAMRDLSSEDNFLLDDVEYTDTEIAWAMRRPVDEWNETPPNLRGATYTVTNFPYRFNWINAIKAELMIMAAVAYRRNELPYQAAGLSVNDKAKYDQYERIAQTLKAEWKQWLYREKRALNFSRAFNRVELRSYGNYPYNYRGV